MDDPTSETLTITESFTDPDNVFSSGGGSWSLSQSVWKLPGLIYGRLHINAYEASAADSWTVTLTPNLDVENVLFNIGFRTTITLTANFSNGKVTQGSFTPYSIAWDDTNGRWRIRRTNGSGYGSGTFSPYIYFFFQGRVT